MKLSVVIPTLRIGDKLQRAIDSFKNEYDELIVVDEKWDNLGKKINHGISQSTGDFIIVANDDVELERGRMWNLCRKDGVVSPLINEQKAKTFHAHVSCFPRWVFDIGVKWPEDYDGFYYDDSDVWMQLNKLLVPLFTDLDVSFKHESPGFTLHTFENGKRLENNQKLFISKWGYDALKTVECI